MSTTYTSTIEVNVWKEHSCISCGTKYRYLFKRTKQGQGGTPDGASANAHNAVIKALEHEVDMHPCPGCGTYQPDMIASQRSGRHWWTFWCSLPAFLLLVILILADVVPYPTGSWLLALAAGMTLLIHLTFDGFNANGNLDANHRLAKDREQAGELWVPKQPKGEGGVEAGGGVNGGHYVAYALLGLGALAFMVPSLLVLATGGTSNGKWNPEVFGPGDETYVYFDKRLSDCVKSLWTGTPQVQILNWDTLGIPGPPPPLSARSNQSSWAAGGSISIGKGDSKSSSPLLWTYVTFPPDERLAGKKLQLRINLSVHFPKLQNSNSYLPTTENHQYNGTVTLSGVKAGSTYRMIWWVGTGVGLLLSTVGGLILPLTSSAFAKKANKTEIFAPDEPGTLGAGDAAGDEDDDNEDDGGRPRDDDRRGRFREE
ncbi:MAG: hypothetical protein ACRC33_29500 [Gemmataceae bacterium]